MRERPALAGGAAYREWLSQVTQCRLEKSAASTNGDLLAALDEAEAAWSICADKVDTIISCQERNSEQTSVLTPRPE
jgi:hypothetical protein